MLAVDTNIWLAAADRRSDRHGECAGLLRRYRGELAAPVPVIAEASWLILDRLGTAAQASYLRLITSGQLTPVDLTAADWQRCAPNWPSSTPACGWTSSTPPWSRSPNGSS